MISRAQLLLRLFILFQIALVNVNAEDNCSELYKDVIEDNSLSAVIDRTKANTAKALKEEPLPITTNIRERQKQKWQGTSGPRAFDALLADGVRFVATPDANSENLALLAKNFDYGNSALLHVGFPFQNQSISTTLYVAKPIESKATINNLDSGYVVGPEYQSTVWHIHGGGTPSAIAANASSKAVQYIKRNIPVVAVNQPGHGNGPAIALDDMKRIVEINLDLMNKSIHPDVKIHLQGHSWGAMITLYTWMMGDQLAPKYRKILERIASYQSESPGSDVSMGIGGPRAKAMAERMINQNIDEWKARTAPGDLEFLENMVENRKMSLVAQSFTFLSDIFYRWAPLSHEEITKRKRLNVLVGIHDGLVYVGREKPYDEYMQSIAGENYTKLDRGKTFRSDDEPQGHQFFDLRGPNGEYVVYQKGYDLIHETTGQEISEISNVEGDINDPVSIINRFFNHFANNFAFREWVGKHKEYVEAYNSNHGRLFAMQSKINKYISKVENASKSLISNRVRDLDSAMKKYIQSYNVKGGRNAAVKNAKKELGVNHSSARKDILKNYIADARRAEQIASDNYVDSIFEADMNKLASEVEANLGKGYVENLIKLEQYVESLRNVTFLNEKIAKTNPGEENYARFQASINDIYNELNLKEQDRNVDYLTDAIKFLKHPNPIEDQLIFSDEAKLNKWLSSYAKYQNEYKNILKSHRRRFAAHATAAVDEVEKPEGINALSDALWELELPILTPERKEQLETFIAGFDQALARAQAEIDQKIEDAINGVERPEGIAGLSEAKLKLDEIQVILDKKYIPEPGDKNHESIRKVVDDLEALEKEMQVNIPGSIANKANKVGRKLQKQKESRTKLVLLINELLGDVTPSVKLLEAQKTKDEKLAALTKANSEVAEAQEDFYIDLFERGELTPENVAKGNHKLDTLTAQFEEALKGADESAESLIDVTFIEAWQGNLRSNIQANEEVLKEALAVLKENIGAAVDPTDANLLKLSLEVLIGKYNAENIDNLTTITPAAGSIEDQIIDLQKEFDSLGSKIFKIQKQIAINEAKYAQFFAGDENSYPNFYQMREINIAQMLDMPFQELVDFLNSKEGKNELRAFKKALTRWEDMWKTVLQENGQKTSELYSVE